MRPNFLNSFLPLPIPLFVFSSILSSMRNDNQLPISGIPAEFLCPLSGTVMADPVIVFSGYTFEMSIVNACVSLSFSPFLPDGAVADFSAVIPNLALRSAISTWCRLNSVDPPEILEFQSAVRIARQVRDELSRREFERNPSDVSVASSDEFVNPPVTRTWPSWSSSSSSGEGAISSSDLMEEQNLVAQLKQNLSIEKQEEALVMLRILTRTQEEVRAAICTQRLLSAVKTLITSKHPSLQINATAVAVNLSLENLNKTKIVRSGMIQPLIDVLKNGFPESRDNSACALFSLSIDDHNKVAIGVLGALGPLLHALRSDSPPTRRDSALALYHLSTTESNRVKLIKLGSVQILLSLLKSGQLASLVMLVLCNLACSPMGRAAMLDAGAVECFVGMLSSGGSDSFSVERNCLSALYGLSYGGRRFKGLAKAVAIEEAIMKFDSDGDEKAKEMVKRIMNVLKDKHDEEEDAMNWEELLDLNQD